VTRGSVQCHTLTLTVTLTTPIHTPTLTRTLTTSPHLLLIPPPSLPTTQLNQLGRKQSIKLPCVHPVRSITARTDKVRGQVVATFDTYRQAALSANQRRRSDYYALPKEHRELLKEYPEVLNKVRLRFLLFFSSALPAFPPSLASPSSLLHSPSPLPRARTRREPRLTTTTTDPSQVDACLELNATFVSSLIASNPFPPPEDAALDAAAPGEGDHEVRSPSCSSSSLLLFMKEGWR